MVREIKNLVGSTASSTLASLNSNYGSVSSLKTFKGNEMCKTNRLQSKSPQSYYHRVNNNGVKQIVKEIQYPNKFSRNASFSVVPETNPTNFDSINNLYQNICKNYNINKSVAIDIPEVTPENEINKNEKIALVQGELDKINIIRDQMASIQCQLQDLNEIVKIVLQALVFLL